MYINEGSFTKLEENLKELGSEHLYEQVKDKAIESSNEYGRELRGGEFEAFSERIYDDRKETYYLFHFDSYCNENDDGEGELTLVYDGYTTEN